MAIKIKSGDLEVIYSGALLTAPGKGAEFAFEDLVFQLIFERDLAVENRGIRFDLGGEKTLKIHCINFDHTLGTGVKQPLPVGKLGQRQLYFSFWAYLEGQASPREEADFESMIRRIVYTFYLGGEVDG